MSFFVLLESLFRLVGLWEGLKDYVHEQEVDKMRNDLLRIHEEEEAIKKAKSEDEIYRSQSTVTRSTE